jgi:hypothetical protein
VQDGTPDNLVLNEKENGISEKATEGNVVKNAVTYSSVVKSDKKLNKVVKPSEINKSIIGSKKQTTLKSLGKQDWLFVSRLQRSTTAKEVQDYLSGEGIRNVEVVELPTRFNSYKSFKVGVSEYDFERSLTAELWPEDVLVKEISPI